MRRGRRRRLAATAGSVLLLAACGLLPSTPVLVRDNIGLFSPAARADAEQRLRELSDQHDMLFFVVTDDRGDPPVSFRGPMADAGALGLPAVALLVGRDGAEGITATDDDRARTFTPPSAIDRMITEGDADEALDLIVRSMSAWARDP
jgi:hypothetical protein